MIVIVSISGLLINTLTLLFEEVSFNSFWKKIYCKVFVELLVNTFEATCFMTMFSHKKILIY